MTVSPTRLDRLRAAMARRVAKGELPGMVMLIAGDDDVHVATIGTVGLESSDPMRRDTIFRIASLTKPVLALATMMLVDDGTLALDDPIDGLLPELANRRVLARVDGPLEHTVAAHRPVTVEDLLTFRMGYGTVTQPTFDPPYPINKAASDLQLVLGPPEPRTPHSPDEWIRRFATLPLMCQPGQRWQYNASSLVLGVLVSRAAGAPLEDVLRTRIFRPLGMVDTGFSVPEEQAHRLPNLYMTNPETGRLEQKTTSAEPWTRPPVFPSGASGLVSTVDDYLAFARVLLHDGVHTGVPVLTRDSVAAMTTNHLTAAQIADACDLLDGRGWGFGLAVAVAPDRQAGAAGRYGWEGGSGTVWFNDPHRRLVGIAMTQTADFLFNGGMAEFVRLATES